VRAIRLASKPLDAVALRLPCAQVPVELAQAAVHEPLGEADAARTWRPFGRRLRLRVVHHLVDLVRSHIGTRMR
jgi:hypothetical protein